MHPKPPKHSTGTLKALFQPSHSAVPYQLRKRNAVHVNIRDLELNPHHQPQRHHTAKHHTSCLFMLIAALAVPDFCQSWSRMPDQCTL
mmetsp:Transcript_38200/g.63406  ORF Transcript_38200/g.63406 Transcript_38200/m.63406 type:complete len:88 (+) Transcript_38200:127-390(+)